MDERARTVLSLLPPLAGGWPEKAGAAREIRLRAGCPAQVIGEGGEWLSQEALSADWIERAADALAAHSLYARDEELRQGYLSLADGSRAGVCGRFALEDGRIRRMTAIRSICVRVSRAVRGCADGCMPFLYEEGRPLSALILSAPGLGKTTLLRDAARQFSQGTAWGTGVCTALADERREMAGGGTLDVGPRTDVMEGCPKAEAIRMLVRAMAPRVIATDELGGAEDAGAVMEAVRCGVAVIATAHAPSIEAAKERAALRPLLEAGVFDRIILLAGGVGRVAGIYDGAGCAPMNGGRKVHGYRNETGGLRLADGGLRGARLVRGGLADAAREGPAGAAPGGASSAGGHAGQARASERGDGEDGASAL